MFRVGEWVQCDCCYEESLWVWRDVVDFTCSACGGHAAIMLSIIERKQKAKVRRFVE